VEGEVKLRDLVASNRAGILRHRFNRKSVAGVQSLARKNLVWAHDTEAELINPAEITLTEKSPNNKAGLISPE
jgi:hypothetical protein